MSYNHKIEQLCLLNPSLSVEYHQLIKKKYDISHSKKNDTYPKKYIIIGDSLIRLFELSIKSSGIFKAFPGITAENLTNNESSVLKYIEKFNNPINNVQDCVFNFGTNDIYILYFHKLRILLNDSTFDISKYNKNFISEICSNYLKFLLLFKDMKHISIICPYYSPVTDEYMIPFLKRYVFKNGVPQEIKSMDILLFQKICSFTNRKALVNLFHKTLEKLLIPYINYRIININDKLLNNSETGINKLYVLSDLSEMHLQWYPIYKIINELITCDISHNVQPIVRKQHKLI
jgi:hypothetical protein